VGEQVGVLDLHGEVLAATGCPAQTVDVGGAQAGRDLARRYLLEAQRGPVLATGRAAPRGGGAAHLVVRGNLGEVMGTTAGDVPVALDRLHLAVDDDLDRD